MVIAAVCKLNRLENNEWLVPRSPRRDDLPRQPDRPDVHLPGPPRGREKCKHLFAVEFTLTRETKPDGTVIETKSITFTEKKTYTQNWPAYNLAQATEKKRFQVLLHDLCSKLAEPERPRGPARSPTLSAIPSSRWSTRSIAGSRLAGFRPTLGSARARVHYPADPGHEGHGLSRERGLYADPD